MGLRNAELKRLYFLDSAHPYQFYRELYLHATELFVASGYFSGSAFSIGLDGLLQFLESEGRLRFVCNDRLFSPDIDAIAEGYEARSAGNIRLQDVLALLKSPDRTTAFGFKCLSYLIAADRLDIKVVQSRWLAHYKIGYAADQTGETVAFHGSVNYTLSGMMLNDEQLHVTCGWHNEADMEHVEEIRAKLEKIWYEEQPGYRYVSGAQIRDLIGETFPPRPIEELQEEFRLVEEAMQRNTQVEEGRPEYSPNAFFSFPDQIRPRDYQTEAVHRWESSGFQSVFAMATATGKTLTALFAINWLHARNRGISTVLVVVPLADLVDQWLEEITPVFGGTIVLGRSGERWIEQLRAHRLKSVTANERLVVISTYQSLARHYDKLIELLDTTKTVIVADEVHRFGSESLRAKLPADISFRIGLSATPKREYDDEGTKAIFDYFCPHGEPFEISIGDAIELGVLCRYYYHCVFVELTEEELSNYVALSERIRRLYRGESEREQGSKGDRDEQTRLLKQRHRVIEQASNKHNAFRELIQDLMSKGVQISNAVLYVPEGKKDDDSVVDLYTRTVYQEFGILVAKYVMGVEKRILDDFRHGRIQLLAAKKRLDEGVNIPAIQTAFFVASSTVEREFVQRRGRILRKSPGKQFASIYDFLVVPPAGFDTRVSDADIQSLRKGEYRRAMIFAENAINRFESMAEIDKHYE